MFSIKHILVAVILAPCLCGVAVQAVVYEPNLPAGFPPFILEKTDDAAPGIFIGSVRQGYFNNFYTILDGAGNLQYFSKNQPLSRFVQPNGFIAAMPMGAGMVDFKDETLTRVDSFAMTPEYSLDTHDVKLLPNGHVLLMGKEVRSVDMSQLVPGGRPDAQVTGNVIQELDANKQVIFEWHTFDHIPITDSFHDLTQKNIDYAHINSVALDPLDDTILASLRTTSEIVKISRTTGQVVWRLSGKGNDFTFIGEHEENAPYYTVGQHDVTRLPNGSIIYFDNGNISGGGINPSDRDYSRAVEYDLDEDAMTATLVWDYRHTPDISAGCTGAVKRFDNGNTFIDWGCAIAKSGVAFTEVTPSGEVVAEMTFPQPGPSASLTKQVWNRPDVVTWQTYSNIEVDQTYDATEAGVSVTVKSLEGSLSYNGLVIRKYDEATRFPRFVGVEPQLLVKRVTLESYGITDTGVDVTFDATDLGANDTSQLTVYYRPFIGRGQFAALETIHGDGETLTVMNVALGEFVFGYPDALEIPFEPIQAEPVELVWTPRGFARFYHLQVATDAAFTDLVLDQSGLMSTHYTLDTVAPDTTYYWRVSTTNSGGTGQWATQSFTTAPTTIQVTVPNGGESWQRGLSYFIRWNDNLAADVAIELYKGDTFVQTIMDQAPSIGAYEWEVDLDLEPGNDYSIRITSAIDAAIADDSDAAFTIQ